MAVNHQPLVIGQLSPLTHLCQGATYDKHLWALFPYFKFVELLVTDIVGDVLDKEHDD